MAQGSVKPTLRDAGEGQCCHRLTGVPVGTAPDTWEVTPEQAAFWART